MMVAVGDGALGDGALCDVALGDGALGDGALCDGALGDGALGDGALCDGALVWCMAMVVNAKNHVTRGGGHMASSQMKINIYKMGSTTFM